MGSVAFKSFKDMWNNNKHIATTTKVRVYEAMATPDLLYNSCTWAGPKQIFEKLDKCQRKHLKQILGIRWYNNISN